MSSEQAQSSVSVRRSLFGLFAALALLTCGVSLSAQTAHVSPALPTTQDAIVLQAGYGCAPIFPPTIVGHTITVSSLTPPPPCFPNIDLIQSFPLPPLEAGSYTVNWMFVNTAVVETVFVFQVTAPAPRSAEMPAAVLALSRIFRRGCIAVIIHPPGRTGQRCAVDARTSVSRRNGSG